MAQRRHSFFYHPPFSDTPRDGLIYDLRSPARMCARRPPLCNRVLFLLASEQQQGISYVKWLVVFLFSFLAFLESRRRRGTKPISAGWCASLFSSCFYETLFAVRMVFRSSVLVWFMLRMVVLFGRRAISRVLKAVSDISKESTWEKGKTLFFSSSRQRRVVENLFGGWENCSVIVLLRDGRMWNSGGI